MDVASAFLSVVPSRRSRNSKGWVNFNCPSCGDKRMRGGLMMAPDGGFRYKCFNGGCEFQEPTGWEPGNGLGGRPRRLFTLLGGDVRDLPLDILMRQAPRYDASGRVSSSPDAEPLVTKFPPMELPEGSMPLEDAAERNDDAAAVLEYLAGRGEEVALGHAYAWSPKHPRMLLVPFFHHDDVVGYMGRSIDRSSKIKYLSRCPPDYVFNQHTLEYGSRTTSIVMEGVLDAIALDCLAVRNSVLTKGQERLLKVLGQRIIMVPDQEQEGLGFVDCAERNGWDVAIPEWDDGVKDACDSVKRYGLLYTIESIVARASRNYMRARVSLRMKEAPEAKKANGRR